MPSNHVSEYGIMTYCTTDYDQLLEWITSAENLEMFYGIHKFEDTKQNIMLHYPRVYPQLVLFGNMDNSLVVAYKLTIDARLLASTMTDV